MNEKDEKEIKYIDMGRPCICDDPENCRVVKQFKIMFERMWEERQDKINTIMGQRRRIQAGKDGLDGIINPYGEY